MAILNFTVNPEEDSKKFNNFEIAEPGWKNVVVTGCEMKPTSTGGQMLVIENTIQGGKEDGITVIDRLNVINKNPKAERIGRAAYAKICHCMGLRGDQANNTDNLFGRQYMIKVTVGEFKSNRPDPETGEFRMIKKNDVKDYRSVQASAQPVAAQAAAQTTGWT